MGIWLVVALLVILPLAVVLEGRRQERRHGKASGGGGALMRAGILELQAMLEADRKIEMVMDEGRATEADEAADGSPPRS